MFTFVFCGLCQRLKFMVLEIRVRGCCMERVQNLGGVRGEVLVSGRGFG